MVRLILCVTALVAAAGCVGGKDNPSSSGSTGGTSTGGSTATTGTSSAGGSSGSSGSTGTTGGGAACDGSHPCANNLLCSGGACVAQCPPGQGYNDQNLCFGACGVDYHHTCVDGDCVTEAAGHCANPSTCPTPSGVDSTGVCGGTCDGSHLCEAGACSQSGTCVAQCPPDQGVQSRACTACAAGQGVSTNPQQCGGPCDYGQATNRCLTGACDSSTGFDICVSTCPNDLSPDQNGDCGGICNGSGAGVCPQGACSVASGGTCHSGTTDACCGDVGGTCQACSSTTHCQATSTGHACQ